MAKFSYLAKSQDGKSRQGFINAVNEDVALTGLQSKGLIVISLKNTNNQSLFKQDLEIFNQVSDRELVIFSRILATFLEVQIPLVEALSLIREQNKKNKYFMVVLDQLIADVQDGNLLSEAMSKHSKVFSNLYVSMTKSGEAAGGLQEALLYMADYLEGQYDLNNKIKGALAYPIFVLLVFLVIGLGIAYYVLPQLVEVLNNIGSDVQLPWTTQLIILGSDILQQYVWFILGGFILLIGGFILFIRTEGGIRWSDKWKLRLPIFGALFTKLYVTRFASNMKTLLQGGIPIITALEISSEVVGNFVFKNIIQDAINAIKGGGQLSTALLRHKEFPYIASQIIAVGEKTGKINSVLDTLSRFYKKEVDNVVNNLTILVEPVMIVGLGIGVAIFVVSILLPIYNIAGSL
jgi:type II secretory pathway component PulF